MSSLGQNTVFLRIFIIKIFILETSPLISLELLCYRLIDIIRNCKQPFCVCVTTFFPDFNTIPKFIYCYCYACYIYKSQEQVQVIPYKIVR